jgi:hypothetical protein
MWRSILSTHPTLLLLSILDLSPLTVSRISLVSADVKEELASVILVTEIDHYAAVEVE